MGTECLYLSQAELAKQVANAIASVGFKNRGAKKRTDLYVLNKTEMPASWLRSVLWTARPMPISTASSSTGFAP